MSEGIAIQDPTVNPIINSPYEEPRCHWELDERGLAKPNVLPSRRESRGTNPTPQPRANTTQPMLVYQGNELTLVNALRTSVREWRYQGYPGVTEPTRRLLDHWNSDQPTPRLFFAQKEAIETLIYMFEVADRNGYHHRTLAEVNEKFNDNIHRLTTKMATGTGKTAVMALIIIWQSVNHSHRPQDPRFTNQFAIVTPSITVRDRNRLDLIPNRPHNIYADWNLVPRRSNYTRPVENAKVAITNFHTLQTKEVTWGQPSTKAKKISRMKPSVETSRDMIKRALGTLSPRRRILVLNDEGHHCHNTQSQLVEIHGEERKNADPLVQRPTNDKGHRRTTRCNRSHSNSHVHNYPGRQHQRPDFPLDRLRLPSHRCHRIGDGKNSTDPRGGRRHGRRLPRIPKPLPPVQGQDQANQDRTDQPTESSTGYAIRELPGNDQGVGGLPSAPGIHHSRQ